jgi:DUF4097 and DUF4098 domain-containing protein YvlB
MVTLALAGLVLAAAAPQRAEFQTDTTVTVSAGTRLSLQNVVGDVIVKTWDRAQVRIQASHSSRSRIGVDLSEQVLRLQPRSSSQTGGWGSMVDYQLTVPASMPIDIEGMGADVRIEGTRAPVKVNTVEGGITVTGGTDLVLVTVNGTISAAGARGRVELRSVSEDVAASDVIGELTVETVSGDIHLTRVDGRRVEAQTVSGNVTFEGALRSDGTYSLSTHSGDVTVAVPEGASALISTAIVNGDVSASFNLPASERASRRRQSFRLGGGGATIELETFSGDIHLVRPNEIRVRKDKEE